MLDRQLKLIIKGIYYGRILLHDLGDIKNI